MVDAEARRKRLAEDDGFASPTPFAEHPFAQAELAPPTETTSADEARRKRLAEDDGFASPTPFAEHPNVVVPDGTRAELAPPTLPDPTGPPTAFLPASSAAPPFAPKTGFSFSPEAPPFVPKTGFSFSPEAPPFVPKSAPAKPGVLSWSEACALGSKTAKARLARIAAAPKNSLIIKGGDGNHSAFRAKAKPKNQVKEQQVVHTTQANINSFFGIAQRSLQEDLDELDKISMPDDKKAGIVKMFQVRDAVTRAKWFIGWGKKCAREAKEASQAAQSAPEVPSERRSDIESTAEFNSQLGDEVTCKPEDVHLYCSTQPPAPARKRGRGFNHIEYVEHSGLAAPTTIAAPTIYVAPTNSFDDPEGFGPMDEGAEEGFSAPPADEGFSAPPEDAEFDVPFADPAPPADPTPAPEAPAVADPAPPADPAPEAPAVADPAPEAPAVADPAPQKNYLITTLSEKIYHVAAAVRATGNGTGDANAVIGSVISNTKSREWIVVRKQGATVEEGFDVGMDIGTAAISAMFNGCCFVFLLKPYSKRAKLPEGWQACAPTTGKTSDDKLVLTYKCFATRSHAFKTNLFMEAVEVSSGIYTHEQMTEHLRWFNMRDWHRLHGDAKRAERLRFQEFPDLAPLHKACLIMADDLTPEIREKDD